MRVKMTDRVRRVSCAMGVLGSGSNVRRRTVAVKMKPLIRERLLEMFE